MHVWHHMYPSPSTRILLQNSTDHPLTSSTTCCGALRIKLASCAQARTLDLISQDYSRSVICIWNSDFKRISLDPGRNGTQECQSDLLVVCLAGFIRMSRAAMPFVLGHAAAMPDAGKTRLIAEFGSVWADYFGHPHRQCSILQTILFCPHPHRAWAWKTRYPTIRIFPKRG